MHRSRRKNLSIPLLLINRTHQPQPAFASTPFAYTLLESVVVVLTLFVAWSIRMTFVYEAEEPFVALGD
jgi:hypothetical protein